MPLDLLVPGLIAAAQAPDAPRFPALERALASATLERLPLASGAAWLAHSFSLPANAALAAVALAGEGVRREGTWLHADPVHIRIERDALALHSATAFEVERAEADALVAALNAHFGVLALEFIAPAPDRWFVSVPEDEVPETTPLAAVTGRDIYGKLPRGTGRINWGSTITETQMILSVHAVNEAREARRAPVVNGVWFWGGGSAPRGIVSPYEAIYADDPFARGLGVLSGASLNGAPEALAAIGNPGAKNLAVLAATPLLEENWFAPLLKSLSRLGAVRVILPAIDSTLVATLRSPNVLAWLRRPKPLSTHA